MVFDEINFYIVNKTKDAYCATCISVFESTEVIFKNFDYFIYIKIFSRKKI